MRSEPRPFNREKFLLMVLGGIFLFQAAVFALGLTFCAKNGGLKACPEIGRRYDSTFSVQIATVLALLGGSAFIGSQRRQSSSASDPALPLEEQPRQLPQQVNQVNPSAAEASDRQAQEQAEQQEQALEKRPPRGKR